MMRQVPQHRVQLPPEIKKYGDLIDPSELIPSYKNDFTQEKIDSTYKMNPQDLSGDIKALYAMTGGEGFDIVVHPGVAVQARHHR